jgi:hypothetical protein
LDPELDVIDRVCVEARDEFEEIPEWDQREEKFEKHRVGYEIRQRVFEDIKSGSKEE